MYRGYANDRYDMLGQIGEVLPKSVFPSTR